VVNGGVCVGGAGGGGVVVHHCPHAGLVCRWLPVSCFLPACWPSACPAACLSSVAAPLTPAPCPLQLQAACGGTAAGGRQDGGRLFQPVSTCAPSVLPRQSLALGTCQHAGLRRHAAPHFFTLCTHAPPPLCSASYEYELFSGRVASSTSESLVTGESCRNEQPPTPPLCTRQQLLHWAYVTLARARAHVQPQSSPYSSVTTAGVPSRLPSPPCRPELGAGGGAARGPAAAAGRGRRAHAAGGGALGAAAHLQGGHSNCGRARQSRRPRDPSLRAAATLAVSTAALAGRCATRHQAR
jgi:hypothetical protein